MHIEIDKTANFVVILNSDEEYYGKYVEGEMGDFAILKRERDDKTIGVCLPLDYIDSIDMHIHD